MFKNFSKNHLIYMIVCLLFTIFLFSAVPANGIFKGITLLFPGLLFLALQTKQHNFAYGFAAGALLVHHFLLNAIVTYQSIDADTFTPFIVNACFLYAPVLPNPFLSIFAVATLAVHFVNYNAGNISVLVMEKISCTILLAVLSSLGIRFLRKLAEERSRFYQASITDPLTGLNTFTHAAILGQKMIDNSNNTTVVMIDIDNFKAINDTYGHFIGNKVLIQFAKALQNLANQQLVVARLGGDEFMLIIDQNYTDISLLTTMLDQLKMKDYLTDDDLNPIHIAFSYGIAVQDTKKAANIEELIHLADEKMYGDKILKNKHLPMNNTMDNNILKDFQKILVVLEEKDIYSYVHSQAVAIYSAFLAKKIGMDDQFIANLYVAGWLHDIGKIAISNNILRKPSKLSATEYTTIQEHVIYGLNLLKSFHLNSTILKAIANHHERYDGNGYPYGRSKNEIPLEGRIIAIADAYSAMTVKRVYRRVLPAKEALQELKKEKATQFDPKLVDVFVHSLLTNKDALRAIC